MQTVTTITPKFQVHIPIIIRKKAGIEKHGKAYIYTEGKTVVIEPLKDDFLSLGGAFMTKKPTPAETIRKRISYTVGKK